MERTWKFPGGYATWTMTVTTAPVAGAVEPFVEDWPSDVLDRFGEYFCDTVNLLECRRLIDERS